jgi:uncharacterized protein
LNIAHCRLNIPRLLLLFSLLLPLSSVAQDFPKRTDRLVNDFTNTLSKQGVRELSTLLEGYERESSIEIAVVIIATLDGYDISQYTFDLGEKWGIGKGSTDNGALMLVSKKDRKIWIATGYGVEGALPDALVSRIISNEILPRFKQDDYFGGIKAGALAIMEATRGEYVGNGEQMPAAQGIGIIAMVVLVFLMIWAIRAMQVKEYAKVNHLGFWAAWALLNSAASKHSGSYRHFSGGGGGFSGGGGFGGFGGGSFGGGGAGGSW